MSAGLNRAAETGLVRTLAWQDPITVFAAFEAGTGALLLDDARAGRARMFALPACTLTGAGPADWQAFQSGFHHRTDIAMWAGLFGYELGGAFERLDLPAGEGLDAPSSGLALFGYPAWADFDAAGETITVSGCDAGAVAALAERIASATDLSPVQPATPTRARPHWSRADYLARARQAVDYVHAGDVFQVNLSQGFDVTLSNADAPFDVFRRLRTASPAPHAAYLRLSADEVVITNSPERFMSLEEGRVETRPIKGTRPRAADPDKDQALRDELHASVKDRAENLMIVDLMRNDLSRVCQPGSVAVPKLWAVESYANVHHLVSVVEGALEPGRDALDLIGASFPPGSITGAPKVRAMEIIAELEAEPRGAYCGALGWLDPHAGALDLNVMIRTVTLKRDAGHWRAVLRSGGGIVADSDPVAEYEETLTKASALFGALGASL